MEQMHKVHDISFTTLTVTLRRRTLLIQKKDALLLYYSQEDNDTLPKMSGCRGGDLICKEC